MRIHHKKWTDFRYNAGGNAGKLYTLGNVGIIAKAITENWRDLKKMVGSDSILDTLAMPIFLASAHVMKEYGNTHGGKACAFFLGSLGKCFIMTRLAIANDWNSFCTQGIAMSLTALTATHSLIKHIKGESVDHTNITTTKDQSDDNTVWRRIKNRAKYATRNYPNALPLSGLVILNTINIIALFSDEQYFYAGISLVWNIGDALTGISLQRNKVKEKAQK